MPRSAKQPIEIIQLPHPTRPSGPRMIVASDTPASKADDSNNAPGAAPHFFGLSIVILGLVLTLLWSGCLAWCAYTLLARFLAA
jgi:hypothetical protein